MKRVWLAVLLALLLGLPATGQDNTEAASAIVTALNQTRSDSGLGIFFFNAALSKAAASHSEEMCRLNYYSSDSPTKGRQKVRQRVNKHGANPQHLTQHVLAFEGDVQVVKAVLDVLSTNCKKDVLTTQYTDIGVGVHRKGGETKVTIVLGGGSDAVAVAPASATPEAKPTAIPGLTSTIVALVNAERQAAGAPLFEEDPKLNEAALGHSDEMLRLDYFSHISPIEERERVRHRVNLAQAHPHRVAENLYRCAGYTEQVIPSYSIRAWLDSPLHRANLLDTRLNRIGVGVARYNGRYYITQVFSGDI